MNFFDGIVAPQISGTTINFPDPITAAPVVFGRIYAAEWQTNILFQFDFQEASGAIPGIIETTGRILGENQITAAGSLGEIIAFVSLFLFLDGVAEIEILLHAVVPKNWTT